MPNTIIPLPLATAAVIVSGLTTVTAQEPSAAAMNEKKPIEIPAGNVMVRPFRVSDFQMEIVLLSVFLLYVLLWFKGKNANMNRAKTWLQGQIEYLQSQFALVGDNRSSNKLMKDGPADFLLYTSGRRNVQFGHWWIKMKKRNDVLTLFSTTVLSKITSTKPSVDRVDLTLHLDKNLTEKFVFAIVKKDQAANLHKNRFDLNRVGKVATSKMIPGEDFTIYSEAQKLVDTILATKIGELINKAPGRLEHLVLSSLPDEEPIMYDNDNHMTLSLSFLMPEAQHADALDPFVELACQIPDILSQLRLPPDVKAKINKNREELVKEYSKKKAADRAEELAKKKAEAKRAEEERIKKMSPAEQRKWEEKERARQMKKQIKRRKA